MTTQDIIANSGFLIGLVGLITGFIIQRDAMKIRELGRDNKKCKGRLLKALNAIKANQAVEAEYAEKEGIDIKSYRAKLGRTSRCYLALHFYHQLMLMK